MTISIFRGDFFKIISDGDKVVFLRTNGERKECYLYTNPCLTAFNMQINRPMHNEAGLIDYSLDVSFRGGEVKSIEHPLIMGVDIFNRLSITDYLDIINEKIKRR